MRGRTSHRYGGQIESGIVGRNGSGGCQLTQHRIGKCLRFGGVHRAFVRFDALRGGALVELDEAFHAFATDGTHGDAVGGWVVQIETGHRTAGHAAIEGGVFGAFCERKGGYQKKRIRLADVKLDQTVGIWEPDSGL